MEVALAWTDREAKCEPTHESDSGKLSSRWIGYSDGHLRCCLAGEDEEKYWRYTTVKTRYKDTRDKDILVFKDTSAGPAGINFAVFHTSL
jgi:hypothetical protein